MPQFADEQWLGWFDLLAVNDFVIIDNFLTDDQLSVVKSEFDNNLAHFNPAGIGALNNNQINEGIRSDYTLWIDRERDPELSVWFDIADETIMKLNRYCYLSLSGFEFHFAHYPKGSFYKKHLDQFKERSNRLISMILYLNERWQDGDGGELKIFSENEPILVPPINNRCILFKSDKVLHEVLRSNVDRKSITGWLLYKPAGLGSIL